MLSRASLLALIGASAEELLPVDTLAPYSKLKTAGFTRYFDYAGTFNASGDVLVTIAEQHATFLDFDLVGVDSMCPRNRTGHAALPLNSCGISINPGNCSNLMLDKHVYNEQLTKIDPWREGNYGYESSDADSGAKLASMQVLAGTGLTQEVLTNKAVVVHDSAGRAVACGNIQSGSANVVLTKHPDYIGAVDFQSGSVNVSTVMRNVAVLSAPEADGNTSALRGVDPKCTADFNPDPMPPNGCGIHIHAGESCEEPAAGHFWDKTDGSHDPWVSLRYAVTAAAADGADNRAQIISKQPIFTGEPLANLNRRAVIIHDDVGNRIACGTLQPFGEAPTTTTTASPAAASSLPLWAIALIALSAIALIGCIIAALCCGKEKKRGLKKKKSSKKAPEPASQPAPQPAVQLVPIYAPPVYNTVSYAAPTYAAPVYAAPVAAYNAAPVATYAAPIPTYATPVATYAPGGVPMYSAGGSVIAPGGSIMMPQ